MGELTEDRARLIAKEEVEKEKEETDGMIAKVAKDRKDGDAVIYKKIDEFWIWIRGLMVVAILQLFSVIIGLAFIILKKL